MSASLRGKDPSRHARIRKRKIKHPSASRAPSVDDGGASSRLRARTFSGASFVFSIGSVGLKVEIWALRQTFASQDPNTAQVPRPLSRLDPRSLGALDSFIFDSRDRLIQPESAWFGASQNGMV